MPVATRRLSTVDVPEKTLESKAKKDMPYVQRVALFHFRFVDCIPTEDMILVATCCPKLRRMAEDVLQTLSFGCSEKLVALVLRLQGMRGCVELIRSSSVSGAVKDADQSRGSVPGILCGVSTA